MIWSKIKLYLLIYFIHKNQIMVYPKSKQKQKQKQKPASLLLERMPKNIHSKPKAKERQFHLQGQSIWKTKFFTSPQKPKRRHSI